MWVRLWRNGLPAGRPASRRGWRTRGWGKNRKLLRPEAAFGPSAVANSGLHARPGWCGRSPEPGPSSPCPGCPRRRNRRPPSVRRRHHRGAAGEGDDRDTDVAAPVQDADDLVLRGGAHHEVGRVGSCPSGARTMSRMSARDCAQGGRAHRRRSDAGPCGGRTRLGPTSNDSTRGAWSTSGRRPASLSAVRRVISARSAPVTASSTFPLPTTNASCCSLPPPTDLNTG